MSAAPPLLTDFWTEEYIAGVRALAHRPTSARPVLPALVSAAPAAKPAASQALVLVVLAETPGTLTLGWSPPAGAVGYEYLVDGKRVSNSWDPTVNQVKFGKPDANQHTYAVVALAAGASGSLQHPAPAPPVGGGPDGNARHLTSLSLDGNGAVEDNFYVAGGYVNVVGTNATVSRFNVGPSNDSNIIVEDGAHGAHIHDGVVHGCGTPRVHSWGDHGLYGSADGLLVERVESYGQGSFGQSWSPRWNSIYDECYSHDSYAGIGVFDYSDGLSHGLPLLFSRYLLTKINGWAGYIDTVRNSHKSGTVGPNTLCMEHYHSTLDLRGESTVPFNLSGDPIDGGSSFYNCIIVWDGAANGWFHSPKKVNLAGNVVLTTAQAAQWLNADWTPKKVAGSPIIGKAVATTGRGHSAIGELPDVGRFPVAA